MQLALSATGMIKQKIQVGYRVRLCLKACFFLVSQTNFNTFHESVSQSVSQQTLGLLMFGAPDWALGMQKEKLRIVLEMNIDSLCDGCSHDRWTVQTSGQGH